MTDHRTRIRTIVVVIGLLFLAVGIAPGATFGASSNQEGVPGELEGLSVHDMYLWCINTQGGTGTFVREYDEFGALFHRVDCEFGLLGSWYCQIYSGEAYFKSHCGGTIPKTSDPLNVIPEDAVTVASQERVAALEPSTGITKPPICPIIVHDPWCERERLAETPTLIQVMVVANPAGQSREETALLPVNGCRIAGGEALVTLTETTVTVGCVGGIGDGLWCRVDERGSMCSVLQVIEASPPPAVGGEILPTAPPIPTEAPPPPTVAVMPTMTPTTVPTPTVAATTEPTPTVAATEPMVEPTIAPPPPNNDNSVPPSGPIEDPTDPELMPTEAPLL